MRTNYFAQYFTLFLHSYLDTPGTPECERDKFSSTRDPVTTGNPPGVCRAANGRSGLPERWFGDECKKSAK